MAELDVDSAVIEEFRANLGQVGGPLAGVSVLLLHHIGARTGERRVTPLVYQARGGTFVVFASNYGAPEHPAWYHNLRARPDAAIEVGTSTLEVRVRLAIGVERDDLWERQKELMPNFADYERRTSRAIPVVVLQLRDSLASHE
jgi:deazaflavin-dependent oxidoreductase (nitroreductase family)